MGRGHGLFSLDAEPTVGTYLAGPATIAVGDYNADGKPDIALIRGGAAVLLNETLPTLDIVPVGLYNRITWSTILGNGFTLQYTANPADPDSWQPFSSAPVSFGYWSGIADWADGIGKFYRLKKP